MEFNMKKVRLFISLLLLAILTLGLSSCKFSLGSFEKIQYKDADKYTVGDGALEREASRIEIDWICGDIRIVRGEVSAITFSEQSAATLDEKHRLHYYLDGDTLRLKCAKSGTRALNFPLKTLTVTVPEGVELDIVEIKSVSANIRVEEQKIDNLFVDTVSGNAEIGVSLSGTLDLKTVSGNTAIALDGTASKVELESVSGDLALVGNAKNLFSESVSGTLALMLDGCPQNLECESVSGNIHLSLPEGSGFRLEYDTTSGDLECEISTRKDGEEYIAGDGVASFEIETTSGDLKITARR